MKIRGPCSKTSMNFKTEKQNIKLSISGTPCHTGPDARSPGPGLPSGGGCRGLCRAPALGSLAGGAGPAVPGPASLCAAVTLTAPGPPTSGLPCPCPGPAPRACGQHRSPVGQQLHAPALDAAACPASSRPLSPPVFSRSLAPTPRFPKWSDQFKASEVLLGSLLPRTPQGAVEGAPPLSLRHSPLEHLSQPNHMPHT